VQPAIEGAGSADRQRRHYDRIAELYATNLGYPHTQEYMRYLDGEFVELLPPGRLGVVVELCCGAGEAYALVADRADLAIGVDVSAPVAIRACSSYRPTPPVCRCATRSPTPC
jgi:SAM-dependent methyltransferase